MEAAAPQVEECKRGRKLHFVPLINGRSEAPVEYLEEFNKYWNQVENHVSDLELKLGRANKIYHELIPLSGEDGMKPIEELNNRSHQIVKNSLAKGAQLKATEESELLTEFMDWSKCLPVGLQNQKVFTKVYESYVEASKKRSEHIAKHKDETLKVDEIGILFMRSAAGST